jgi:pimeloyl-ACP methyl ester carboxylesterase
MNTSKMPDAVDHDRRHFLGAAAAAVIAANFSLARSAVAKSSNVASIAMNVAAPVSFASIKQIDAGLLNVGYAEAGPADGPAVMLLHGWPYDIHSFVEVAPLLASHGYRVIVPYLRGYGTTRFLSSTTMRSGQQSAVALDIIAPMDALDIQRAVVAGFDWGARTAAVMAGLWPERCKAIVSVGDYLISNRAIAKLAPFSPSAALAFLVPVLFRYRSWPHWLCAISLRLR